MVKICPRPSLQAWNIALFCKRDHTNRGSFAEIQCAASALHDSFIRDITRLLETCLVDQRHDTRYSKETSGSALVRPEGQGADRFLPSTFPRVKIMSGKLPEDIQYPSSAVYFRPILKYTKSIHSCLFVLRSWLLILRPKKRFNRFCDFLRFNRLNRFSQIIKSIFSKF